MTSRFSRTIRASAVVALVLASLMCAGIGLSISSAQQRYPVKPVTVIIPFAAGGSTDQMARPLFDLMSKNLGAAFIIENRGGAGGTIGTAQIKAAAPDGYTIGFSPTSPLTSAPHLMKKLSFDLDDFELVCQVFDNIFTIAVGSQSPFKTLPELIAFARANPGRLTYGSSGVASLPHLTGEGFAQAVGINVIHVPFRGDGQVIPNVLSGQVDFSFTNIGSAAGTLRVLAIFSETRHPAIPDVPTAEELGLPSMPPGLQGIFVRKGTSEEIIDTLERACRTAVETESYQQFGKRLNQLVGFFDRTEFTKRAREDYEFKRRLIRDLKLAEP
jgi:tripartite-type tricarboxylate transporter receptor subunit TctC